MQRIGFIGWRGMVGSVLLRRLIEEDDFQVLAKEGCTFHFFTTSQKGCLGPNIGFALDELLDAYALDILFEMDILVCCQGSVYTQRTLIPLRKMGWRGYWLDVASTLRLHDDSMLVLDPINSVAIDVALTKGIKNFIGCNCTVSLLLMAFGGLFNAGLVEWISTMTYQAASGAGSQLIQALLQQMGQLYQEVSSELSVSTANFFDINQKITSLLQNTNGQEYPYLAGNLIPFIDQLLATGQSREEWKAQAEANKILNQEKNPIAIDGICVRVGTFRCHSQAVTIKLAKTISLEDVTQKLSQAHPYIKIIDNTPELSKRQLTPAATSGTLAIKVGRLRMMSLGPKYLSAFTVGDQLLWGAAEPLRRMLKILVCY